MLEFTFMVYGFGFITGYFASRWSVPNKIKTILDKLMNK